MAGVVGEQSRVLAGSLADVGDDVAGDVKDTAEPTAEEVHPVLTMLGRSPGSQGTAGDFSGLVRHAAVKAEMRVWCLRPECTRW